MTRCSRFCMMFLVFLSACTTLSAVSEEERISRNVKLRWQALIERNWSDAYQFETIGYRESHTVRQFKSKFGQAVAWKQVEVKKISLDKSTGQAIVKVGVSYEIMMPMQGLQRSTAYLSETWLLDEGKWMHYTK